MKKIVLTTLNARYSHASIGLRYLYANLGVLQNEAVIEEFVINDTTSDIAEKILSHSPVIIGIGVYIWNALEVSKLVNLLKKISPDTIIILGGPEVSHLPIRVDVDKADYIIQGEGDLAFGELCVDLLNGTKPAERIIHAELPDINLLQFPYQYYTDHDIKHRVIYVEASRGCPYKCEFCLSSLDKTVRNFDLEKLLGEFDNLWRRGARTFKFIDRTFNLNIKITERILDYFLAKEDNYFLHFEVIPDNFPESLRERIKQFRPASLQLEIGIQTLNPRITEDINRRMNFEKIKDNLHFLETETETHLHVDLIVGLPGESVESFGENLDKLMCISSCEVQVGILKKLSGTAISRHDKIHGIVYSDLPPYDILKNNLISFEAMQKMKRFARFWDMIYNRGNFNLTVRLLWQNGKVFEGFYEFSEWIYSQTLSTYQISLERLAELIFRYLTEVKKKEKVEIANILAEDILKIPGRNLPGFLSDVATEIPEVRRGEIAKANKRQIKHL